MLQGGSGASEDGVMVELIKLRAHNVLHAVDVVFKEGVKFGVQ